MPLYTKLPDNAPREFDVIIAGGMHFAIAKLTPKH